MFESFSQIGSQRLVRIGIGQIFEELTGLNNETFTMTYKLVSNVNNVNPFPASFLNYKCTYKLRRVTVTSHTFIDITAHFMTEHHLADTMRNIWKKMFEDSLANLQRYVEKHMDAQSQTPQQSMEYRTLSIPAHSESPSCPVAIPSTEDHLQLMRISSMNVPTSRGVKRLPSSSSEDSRRMQSEGSSTSDFQACDYWSSWRSTGDAMNSGRGGSPHMGSMSMPHTPDKNESAWASQQVAPASCHMSPRVSGSDLGSMRTLDLTHLHTMISQMRSTSDPE